MLQVSGLFQFEGVLFYVVCLGWVDWLIMAHSLLPRFRKLVASSGTSASAFLLAGPPDTELVRQARLVDQVLKEANKLSEERKGKNSLWEEETDIEDVKQVEEALLGASATIKAMRSSLARIAYVSQHQADHYEAIVQLLERKKTNVSALVNRIRTSRLAVLASQTRVRKLLEREELIVEEKGKDEVVPLYGEEELQIPKFDDLNAEERKLLEFENQELQIGMMDVVVDSAQSIQRQLGELAVINAQFALEMSVQHEVRKYIFKKQTNV
jgi:hypothetical protein